MGRRDQSWFEGGWRRFFIEISFTKAFRVPEDDLSLPNSNNQRIIISPPTTRPFLPCAHTVAELMCYLYGLMLKIVSKPPPSVRSHVRSELSGSYTTPSRQRV